ncbi:bifunctional indole-3-glycerol-phosphate synthase TrpC/phosphoribosylanthranilate isomerase TrpF [Pseudidiomarina sp. 1ASP75-5]|nr:bifunctional indole-3-glycerol-phosphate synthase TrpC/phosphoribosylanthranilate isomerase TrpF [Pseudidiomarina sp. 1APR75-33.1]MDN7134950.1 bifunctional indole-3-glycerol-phosphate synthase TrpC/phosphoribosylanthranilate isomerase TrpF [Pseudidiomarina sp. 1ASP75-5]MDN7137629.1 bifunctional indole-3-glycerol-phosphate synthase TrpC/phosphoribosylanthranilate isomerase TrpF [Pseudidiomarina sp. 1ASP75-14]
MVADTILQSIVNTRRQRLVELAREYPVDALKQDLKLSQRSLAKALATPASSFILECKKASPSKGMIRDDFHPVRIAQTYSRYAAAISVLTEPDYFQGDFAYLAAVSSAVDLPILCKDFIVDPLQVLLARHFGADAILLMLSILSDEDYRELAQLAADYNLDVLTEVSTEEEMLRAKALGANIIGINNRNLHDLSIDPKRSQELSKLAPAGVLLVAESGYSEHQHVRETAPFVDGFLVGSALTAQANIDQACRELIYGKHKVCGLNQVSDAHVVRAAGAAYGGLIFVQHSPRAVTAAQARQLVTAEPDLSWVGVFADHPLAEVVKIASELSLAAVQLHGHEDADYIAQLKQALPSGTEVWQVHRVEAPLLLPQTDADAILLDNLQGGSGKTFAWELLQDLTPAEREHCILAGGLGRHNLSEAQQTGLQRFDFNSAVERTKGVKDAGKIVQLFQQIRQYGKQDHE